jgi:hypothetical protein
MGTFQSHGHRFVPREKRPAPKSQKSRFRRITPKLGESDIEYVFMRFINGTCAADQNICMVVNQDVVHKRQLV